MLSSRLSSLTSLSGRRTRWHEGGGRCGREMGSEQQLEWLWTSLVYFRAECWPRSSPRMTRCKVQSLPDRTPTYSKIQEYQINLNVIVIRPSLFCITKWNWLGYNTSRMLISLINLQCLSLNWLKSDHCVSNVCLKQRNSLVKATNSLDNFISRLCLWNQHWSASCIMCYQSLTNLTSTLISIMYHVLSVLDES